MTKVWYTVGDEDYSDERKAKRKQKRQKRRKDDRNSYEKRLKPLRPSTKRRKTEPLPV